MIFQEFGKENIANEVMLSFASHMSAYKISKIILIVKFSFFFIAMNIWYKKSVILQYKSSMLSHFCRILLQCVKKLLKCFIRLHVFSNTIPKELD